MEQKKRYYPQRRITLSESEVEFIKNNFDILNYKEISEKIGVPLDKLKHNIRLMGLKSPFIGGKRKEYNEKKVTYTFGIKRIHYNDVHKKINELLKDYQ